MSGIEATAKVYVILDHPPYYGNICNRLTQTHAPMYMKQTSLIGANLNCHLRYILQNILWNGALDRHILGFLLCIMPFIIHYMFVTYVTFWVKIFDPRYLVTDPQSHGS